MRLRLANAATRRTSRSSSSPISCRLLSLSSSCRLRRAEKTVMMMSDISGILDINVSIASRGTSITRVSRAAIQKRDFSHKLSRAEREGQMTFFGVGIDNLDLALLDINEANDRFPGP